MEPPNAQSTPRNVSYSILGSKEKKIIIEKVVSNLRSFCSDNEFPLLFNDIKLHLSQQSNKSEQKPVSTVKMDLKQNQQQSKQTLEPHKKLRKVFFPPKIDLNEDDAFSILPPHIIISKILTYANFVATSPFECWGYFKNDPSRHLWWIFKSITLCVEDEIFQQSLTYNINYYDFRKMERLVTNILVVLKLENVNFNSLKKIITYSIDPINNFFVKNTFKNLEEISIFENGDGDIETGNVNWNLPNLKRIEYSNVSRVQAKKVFFFEKNNCEKLEKIQMKGINFEDSKKWGVLKNLKYLCLVRCNVDDLFFVSQSGMMKKIEFLKLLGCLNLEYSNWGLRKFDNLKSLCIGNSMNGDNLRKLNDKFFGLEFPKLEVLYLRKVTTIKGVNWSEMKELKSLKVYNCLLFQDDIFETYHLNNLRVLVVSNSKFISGKKWNPIPNIESIVIINCIAFDDTFFQTGSFTKLKYLSISLAFHQTGKNWKPMKALEKMSLEHCRVFDDSFFVSRTFEKLVYLSMINCPQITGKGWGDVPVLGAIRMVRCQNFVDDFFQDFSLRTWLDGKILHLPMITGDKFQIFKWSKEELAKEISNFGVTLVCKLKEVCDECLNVTSCDFSIRPTLIDMEMCENLKVKNFFKVIEGFRNSIKMVINGVLNTLDKFKVMFKEVEINIENESLKEVIKRELVYDFKSRITKIRKRMEKIQALRASYQLLSNNSPPT